MLFATIKVAALFKTQSRLNSSPRRQERSPKVDSVPQYRDLPFAGVTVQTVITVEFQLTILILLQLLNLNLLPFHFYTATFMYLQRNKTIASANFFIFYRTHLVTVQPRGHFIAIRF